MSAEERRRIQIELGRLSGDMKVLEKGWDSKPDSAIPRLPPLGNRSYNTSFATAGTHGGVGSSSDHTDDSVGYSSASSARAGLYSSPHKPNLTIGFTARGNTAHTMSSPQASKRSQELAAKRKRQLEAKRRQKEEQLNKFMDTKKLTKKQRKAQENNAALKIQCAWKGKKARAELQHLKQEQDAAVTIQSSFRAFKARKEKEKRQKAKEAALKKKNKGTGPSSPRGGKSSKDALLESFRSDEDDEPLTLEEIASLTKQFKLVDADNSGGIDRLEFAVFYNLVAKSQLSRRDCDALFDELDADGSGSLSLNEFLKVYKILLSREKLKSTGEAERLRKINEKLALKAKMISDNRSEMRKAKTKIETDREVLNAKNQDAAAKAKLDAKEKAKQREEDEKRRQAEIQAEKEREAYLLELASQKKEIELFIHKAEVKAIRLEQEGAVDDQTLIDEFSPEEIDTLRKQFQKVDTDNSGTIDKDEFAVFYNRVSIEQVSHNEGISLFKQLDVDGSGTLAFEEFISVYTLLQQRERARKDPDQKERLRKMDEKLAGKAKSIADARQKDQQTRLEASVMRMKDDQHNKAMRNEVLQQKRQAAAVKSGPSAPGSKTPGKTPYARKSVVGK